MEQAKVKVRGVGRASGKPEHAVMVIDVRAATTDAEEAMAKVSEDSKKVETILAELGIPAESVTTKHAELADFDDYRDREGPRKVQARNQLEVLVPDEERVGILVTEIVRRTEAHISGPTWEVTPTSGLHREALRLASEDAKSKAEAHAAAMGVTLGPILEIEDYRQRYNPYHERLGQFTSSHLEGPPEPAFQVFEGRVHVEAEIEATFALEIS